jgi:choloylglycine hydrolase
MITRFQQTNNVNNTDYAFNILDKVRQPDFTKWSIVYDITNREIHFTTNKNAKHKTVQFKFFDFLVHHGLLLCH